MSILLNLQNLSLSFGSKSIFNQAELTVHEGEKIGLIGLNGQGKSTLFKILTGEVTPDESKPPFIYDRRNENFDIFYIPQELNIKDFPLLTIENYFLAFYPELYSLQLKIDEGDTSPEIFEKFEKLNGWGIQNNYLSYLKGFDFQNLDKSLDKLSGGERRKIALSVGLSSEAKLILWDEPTNHLDIETIERFEDELIKSKKTYLIISHDRYLLNHTTDKIVHIEQGKITSFKGKYLDYLIYLEEKEAELAKNLDKLENRHRRELAWMRQGVKARGTRSKKRVEGFHDIKSGIQELKERSKKKVNLSLKHSGRKSKELIRIEEGNFSFPDLKVFNQLDLVVAKKDRIALIGPNGAGKSTLINIFREKLKLNSGKFKAAQDLKIVVFDQNRESLNEEMTPLEIVGEGNDFVALGDGTRKHVHSYLADFLFSSDQINRPVATLSGGEKNRLQLAMFMRSMADLWVFDEPTNDLDIETIELLEKELKSYEAAVIIISHDRAFVDNICEKTWLIHDNNIEAFEGGYTQVAPYLHALAMEKKLEPQVKAKANEKVEEKGLSYAEKKKLKELALLIEESENQIIDLDKKLGSFDFENLTEQKRLSYEGLVKLKEQTENKLSESYEQWEDLESRSID